MKLLNTKLSLECDEYEEIHHEEEIEKIYMKICKFPNIDCALAITDSFNDEPKIEICKLHDVFETLEKFDCKNGIDIYQDNLFITIVLNGQTYKKREEMNIFFTYVQVLPLDANGNVVKGYFEF